MVLHGLAFTIIYYYPFIKLLQTNKTLGQDQQERGKNDGPVEPVKNGGKPMHDTASHAMTFNNMYNV